MWILSYLPTWIFYALTVLGIIGLISSYVLGMIPLITQYRLPLQILSIVVIAFGVFIIGGVENELSWQAKVKELEAQVAVATAKSNETNTKIEQKVITKIQIVKQQVEVIKREIEVQKEYINTDCKVNPTAVDLYNKAIADPAGVTE
jgi:sensor domain CHASE-containing protein